jgi:hypothetical protein
MVMIERCQRLDPGSIPGGRTLVLLRYGYTLHPLKLSCGGDQGWGGRSKDLEHNERGVRDSIPGLGDPFVLMDYPLMYRLHWLCVWVH